MRDYPAMPNDFRINSSSSILSDDQTQHQQQRHTPQQKQQENLNMNGDINLHHHHRHHHNHQQQPQQQYLNHHNKPTGYHGGSRQNSGSYIKTISNINDHNKGHSNYNLATNSNRHEYKNEKLQSGSSTLTASKRNNVVLWIVTPVTAR